MRIGRISLLFGFAFLSASVGYSQGPAFEWVVSIGAAATFSGGYGIGHDDLGNVYVAGRFTGTADFDPGPGTTSLISAGALDAYITKVDAGGNLVWARRVGGPNDDYSLDMFVDDGGNVYATGAFSGTADFDPGPGTFNLSSAGLFIDDIFVLKLDTDGNLAWARKIGGADFDFGRSITVSSAGNVFITGNFRGTVDFDPGPGTSVLTSVSGGNDIFVSKLDASGNFVWARRMGGSSSDIGYAVTVDAAENVFTTGSFSTTADFDPGSSVFNLTEVNNGDIFISKLDAAGNFVWAKGMGGTSSDIGYGVQVDNAGNVYTTGYFESISDFDPGPGTASLVSAGFNDAFICKLDVNGNYLWAKGMGGTSDEESSGLSLDEYGNVYATGGFESTVDFDPGPGTFNLTPVGSGDGFVVKLNGSGDFVWVQAFGGLGRPTPEGIDVGSDGSIYTTGYFSGTVDFNTGSGVSNVTAAGSNNTFIHKMREANFITQWNLATAGSGATQLSFGTATSGGSVNYTWQEISPGSASGSGTWMGSPLLILGLPPGATIRLQIAPTNFQQIIINNGADRNRLTRVEQWGTTAWTSMQDAFNGCTNLQVTATDIPNLTGVADMSGMFHACANLNSPSNINTWNTATVTNMQRMFEQADAFNQNIGAWNTGAVTTMREMFYDAIAFNQYIGAWNTAAVTDMEHMFFGADAFNQYIGAWNTGSVTNMFGMFKAAILFNQYIGAWNIGAVTTMNGMFSGASTFNQNIGAWTLNPAVNLSSMFGFSGMDCNNYSATLIGWSANPLTPIGRTLGATGRQYGTDAVAARNNLTVTKGWTITGDAPSGGVCINNNFVTVWNLATAGSNATELSFGTGTSGTVNYTWQEISPGSAIGSGTWSGAILTISGLPTGATIRLEIAPTNFRQIIINNGADRNRLTQIENWGSTAWISMLNAFRGCFNLQVTATDVPNLLGVSNMSTMFSNCPNLNSPANINTWNTSAVTNMNRVFFQSGAFNQNIGSWNTAAVTNMSEMFYQASAFNQNIGSWSTATVTNMFGMFNGAITFNQDIGAWNTGAVTNMSTMFRQATVFNQNIGSWNTAAVTNMSQMFTTAIAFNQDIGAWSTGAVTNMSNMFNAAIAFNQDIGSWNTGAVTTIQSMFWQAFAFNQNIGSWNTAAVTDMIGVFSSAPAFNQDIGSWNTAAVTDMSGMFSNATAFNQNIGFWNTAAVTQMLNMFASASAFNQNIGTWTLNPLVSMTNMLNNSGMDCNNYSATLIGWSANPLTPSNRSLGAIGRQYGTNADAARINLDIAKGWTITGDTPSGSSCVASCVPASQHNALIALYNSTDGDNWTNTLANNAKWTGADESTWFGVTVNSCNITEVSLGNNNLTGFIPTEIKNLPNLTNLALSENKLSGGIPVELGNLASLRYLDLLSNQLTGTIPDQLGNITTLEGLNLSDNLLSGTIPISLGGLPILSFLEVYSNQLTGTIPDQLGNASSMAFMRLSDNKLTGSIPSSFGNLTQLFLLDLEQNLLTGPIPTEFGNLTLLRFLNLYSNQLTGSIPATFGNLINLETLNIFTNQLSGTLPIELALCTQLKHLEVAENLFTGTLPIAYQSLVNLEIFQINNNSFTGPVPIEYLAWTNIKDLYLSNNQLDALPTFPPALITNLAVENNNLEFGDLESNIGTTGYVYSPQKNLAGGTASICEGTTLTISFSTSGTANSYQWFKEGALISGATSATYSKNNATLSDAGNYTVQITSSLVPGLALQSDNFIVSISTLAKPVIITSNCTATSATLSGPAGLSIYAWSNGANTQQISITSPGSYTLTITNGSGCVSVPSDATTFTATFCNQPPVITTTSISTTVEGTVTVLLSSLLSDPDGNLDLSTLKIVKQPTSGATASLDASSQLILNYAGRLFSGTDELTIEVCDFSGQCVQQVLAVEVIGDITIYNGISPNGDGLNDTWLILYIDVLTETKENKVFVYNRWGDVVFEAENYDNKDIVFKGLNKSGNELPSGTYFYKIEFGSGRKTLTGYLAVKK